MSHAAKLRTASSASDSSSLVAPWIDAMATRQASDAARRSSSRRRLLVPTTGGRDYLAAECEFVRAMQAYKQASGRMFPTWSEVLEVLQGLGYQKVSSPG
jgi:hypothetical protein